MVLEARVATEADAELIWRWRNDAVARENSLRSEPIPWHEHKEWFAARLHDPEARLYMLDHKVEGPVAHARYERREGLGAKVHLIVAPAVRGRGLGKKMMEMTLPLAFSSLKIRRVEAIVKKSNTPSLRTFLGIGFVLQGEVVCCGSSCMLLYLEGLE